MSYVWEQSSDGLYSSQLGDQVSACCSPCDNQPGVNKCVTNEKSKEREGCESFVARTMRSATGNFKKSSHVRAKYVQFVDEQNTHRKTKGRTGTTTGSFRSL